MSHFCPHCGYNLKRDEPIRLGAWWLFPAETLYDGAPTALSKQEAAFLHTVASARPRIVSAEIVGGRISDSEDPSNLAAVIAFKVRKKLGEIVPFITLPKAGYRWGAAI